MVVVVVVPVPVLLLLLLLPLLPVVFQQRKLRIELCA